MKKTILLFISICSLSQILVGQEQVILDQTPQKDWYPSSAYLGQLVVYDNDIIYNINKTTASFRPEVLLNYGVPNTSIDIDQNQKNQAIRLKMDVPFFLFRQFFDGGYYESGTEIFGQRIPNSNKSSTSVVQLNKSRTMFVPTNYGFKSIEKIAKHTVVARDTIKSLSKPYFFIKMVQRGYERLIKIPEIIYTNGGSYGGMFLHNNTLHFAVSIAGRSELFADGGFGEAIKITKLEDSTTGTAPSYMTSGLGKIWFSGKNVIDDGMGGTDDLGWELCYANGSPDLNEPPAKGFGYFPYETGTYINDTYYGSSPVIFGKINGKIIYYAQNSAMKKMYAHLISGNVELNIPDFEYNYNDPFGILNDKLYIISSFKTGPYLPKKHKLVEIDGTSSGSKIYELPVQGATNFFIHKNELYYVGGNKFVKFNPITKAFEVIFEGEGYAISDVTPYQNGFVFIERDNQYGAYSLKLKGWNIEQRQVIHDSQNKSKNSSSNQYELKFNKNNYSINLHSINFTNPDKLKIQLLDSSSNKIQLLSPEIPIKNGEINASLMYAINTFKDANSHSSEISFGYDETMFPEINNFDPAKLIVNSYQNGISKTISGQLDMVNKSIKISAHFEDESFIYFSYSGALSIKENFLKSKLSIFPNPATSAFTIKMVNNAPIKNVKIYDLLGKKVLFHKTINQQNTEINVSNLSKGVYVVKARVNDYTISKKLILH